MAVPSLKQNSAYQELVSVVHDCCKDKKTGDETLLELKILDIVKQEIRSKEYSASSNLQKITFIKSPDIEQKVKDAINTFFEKFERSVRNLVNVSIGTPAETIFSFLSPKDRAALMQTNSYWQKAGGEYLSGSRKDAVDYVKKSMAKGLCTMKDIPPYFRKNIMIGLFALVQNIENYNHLDPELQNDPEIMRVVVLSDALHPTEASKELLKKIPESFLKSPDMQKRIADMRNLSMPSDVVGGKAEDPGKARETEGQDMPRTPFWDKFGPFIFAGTKQLPLLIEAANDFFPDWTELYFPPLYFPDRMKNNPEFKKIMLQVFRFRLFDAMPHLTEDKEFFEEALRLDGKLLRFGSPAQKADPKLVKIALERNGIALEYAHSDFQKNPEFVLIAIKENPFAVTFCHEDLQNNQEFLLNAIKERGVVLQFVKEPLVGDLEFVKKAVELNPCALVSARDEFRNNPQFLFKEVRSNFSVAEKALQQYGGLLRFLDENLQNDPHLARIAIQSYPLAFMDLSDSLKRDENIALFAIERLYENIHFVGDTLKNNRDFAIKAIKLNPRVAYGLTAELRKDPEILKHIPKEIMQNLPQE